MMKRKILTYVASAVSVVLFAVSLILFAESGEVSAMPDFEVGGVDTTELTICEQVPEDMGCVPMTDISFAGARYVKIAEGGFYQLTVSTAPDDANESYYFESSSERIATVSKDGLVTGYSEGESIITVKNYNRRKTKFLPVRVMGNTERILNVPFISQLRDYPNGCESCSTVMALNYVGINITVDDFIEKYLDMKPLPAVNEKGVYSGYDPWYYFLGDPREQSGLCCYSPAIENALKKFVDTETYQIDVLRDVPLEELCRKYINNGTPVIFWGTMYMNAPYYQGWSWQLIDGEEGERFEWVFPMHCLLMVGYDEEYYYFNDPVAGKKVAYTKADTEAAYDGLYRQAIAVYRKSAN